MGKPGFIKLYQQENPYFFQVLDKKATSVRVIPFGYELKTFSFFG